MKKFLVFSFALLVFGATSANAQSILDKIDRTINKVDRTVNTADRAANTGKRVGGLLGKNEGKNNKTTIAITGINYARLKTINSAVNNAKGVSSTKMKFNASGSYIYVQHKGSTEDLLAALQKASPATFAEKNLDGVDDGDISVYIK